MAQPTYKQVHAAIMGALLARGWSVNTTLKVPYATSPNGLYRLWFKAQAIYSTAINPSGRHTFGDARSTHAGDIRKDSLAHTLNVIDAEMRYELRPGERF